MRRLHVSFLVFVVTIVAVASPVLAGGPNDPEASKPAHSASPDLGYNDVTAVWTVANFTNGTPVLSIGATITKWDAPAAGPDSATPACFEFDFNVNTKAYSTFTQFSPTGWHTSVRAHQARSGGGGFPPAVPPPVPPKSPPVNVTTTPPGVTPIIKYGSPATMLLDFPPSLVPVMSGDVVSLTNLTSCLAINAPQTTTDSLKASRSYVVAPEAPPASNQSMGMGMSMSGMNMNSNTGSGSHSSNMSGMNMSSMPSHTSQPSTAQPTSALPPSTGSKSSAPASTSGHLLPIPALPVAWLVGALAGVAAFARRGARRA
jgi:hypothetical protein